MAITARKLVVDLTVGDAEFGTGRVYFYQVPRPEDACRVETQSMGFHLRLCAPSDAELHEEIKRWQALKGQSFHMTLEQGFARAE